jgi:hypothetical protein
MYNELTTADLTRECLYQIAGLAFTTTNRRRQPRSELAAYNWEVLTDYTVEFPAI